MNFEPLKDRILVERDLADDTVGGIYLTEGAREKLNTGTVRATGKKVRDVAVGDRVMFGKNDGVKVPMDGYPNHILLSETHVWGILD